MPSRKSGGGSLFSTAPLPVADLNDAERVACLQLIRSDNVGPVAFRELINLYGGAKEALAALPDIQKRRGSRSGRFRLCPARDAEAELDAAERAGAKPIFTIEPGYPMALAAIDAPPPLVYVRGDAALLSRPAVGIVGSRQASAAGLKLAGMFAKGLSDRGYVIVSGLARGVDAAAHHASLGGGTVAVLAGGIDQVYPPEHDTLQEEIAAHGCLVTEQPPGFVPRAKDFPRRNRLISGISYGVLVIEAAKRSGTLVTARFAAEQGRDVFAVPGHPLDPRAEGTNQLLKSGALLVTEVDDVVEALSPMITPVGLNEDGTASRADTGSTASDDTSGADTLSHDADHPDDVLDDTATPEEAGAKLLSLLGPQPIDLDTLCRASGLGIQTVRIALLELDLAGHIERHGAQLVSRRADVGPDVGSK